MRRYLNIYITEGTEGRGKEKARRSGWEARLLQQQKFVINNLHICFGNGKNSLSSKPLSCTLRAFPIVPCSWRLPLVIPSNRMTLGRIVLFVNNKIFKNYSDRRNIHSSTQQIKWARLLVGPKKYATV